MADVELVGLDEDGEHVLLVSSDGARFRLRIDEPLRAAVRRDRPQLEQLRATAQGSLPPRDIQARIRSGMTAQEVAESAGISVKQVRRYEGPVLAEREFIATQAQRAKVGREPDAPSLGDLVTDRLAAREVDTDELSWDAARPADGPWTVRVDFVAADEPKVATWTFDPQTHTLSALDDESRWLSETAVADEPVPRRHLSPVRSRVFDVEAEPLEPSAPSAAEPPAPPVDRTAQILHDLSSKRGVRQPTEDLPEDEDPASDFEGFGPQQTLFEPPVRSAPSPHEPAAEQDAKLYSLTAGPRPSAPSPAALSPEPVPEAPSGEAGSAGGVPPEQDDVPPPLEKVKPSRKGRSKVPSWDEIVFGAKPE